MMFQIIKNWILECCPLQETDNHIWAEKEGQAYERNLFCLKKLFSTWKQNKQNNTALF